jgi:uncharacterized protein YjiS (DUF1127 family)
MIALSHVAFVARPRRTPALQRLLLTLEGWAERRRQRRALLALNDHALKDIGLSGADAWQEGGKPFWRT